MHRSPPWLLAAVLPLTMGSMCADYVDDVLPLDNAALEVFLLHTPDVGADYGLELEQGEVTMVEVFLYKPLDTGGNSKVSGATVRMVMPDQAAVELEELEAGHYRAMSTDVPALYFEERGTYQVVATHEDQTWSASALAFVETKITSPTDAAEVEQGAPLTVSMASPAEAMVALVFDEEGTQVHDTLPSTADALLELVDGEGVQEMTIEGSALAHPGLYLIGVGGIEKAEWIQHSDNLYTSLSVFASGSMDAVAVSTVPLEGMAGMLMAVQGDDLAQHGIEVEEQVQALLYGVRLGIDGGLEEQPLEGAEATVSWGANTVTLNESAETPGLYEANSETHPGLEYTVGATYAFDMSDGDETYRLSLGAPQPPSLEEPEAMSYHAPGTALEIPCPADRDLCFAVLLDGDGEELWSDMPTVETVDQVFSGDIGTPGGSSITLPGGFFTTQGQLYAIGLLGLNQVGEDGISASLNPELADLAIGTTSFTAITTVQVP
jgi:hypothetical protein